MANQEHLDILKQGVEIWNEWRNLHSEVTADLRGANLSYSNLSRIDLSDSDLIG